MIGRCAHALTTANDGPVIPYSIVICARGRVGHHPHDREWMHARILVGVKTARLFVMRAFTANAGADDARRAFAASICREKTRSGLRDGFTRGDERELRHAIEHPDQTFLNRRMRQRIETAHFRSDFYVEQIAVGIVSRSGPMAGRSLRASRAHC